MPKKATSNKVTKPRAQRGARAKRNQRPRLRKHKPQPVGGFTQILASDEAKLVHSIFNPRGFNSRGVCFGSTKSALCSLRSSFALTGSSGYAYTFFKVIPQDINANWLQYAQGANQTTIATAWSYVGGPWNGAGNPATVYRIVGCELQITPTSSMTNMAGDAINAFVPDIANYTPSMDQLLNADFVKVTSAAKQIVGHWFPMEQTDYTYDSWSASVNPKAGFAGIWYLTNVNSMRIDINWHIEYIPTLVVKPIVDLHPATISQPATRAVSNIVNTNPDLVIGTREDYEAELAIIKKRFRVNTSDIVFNAWNTAACRKPVDLNTVPHDELEEEKRQPFDPPGPSPPQQHLEFGDIDDMVADGASRLYDITSEYGARATKAIGNALKTVSDNCLTQGTACNDLLKRGSQAIMENSEATLRRALAQHAQTHARIANGPNQGA